MDIVDSRARRQRVVDKRGAYTWLPLLFANDLVHGSWWFVVHRLSIYMPLPFSFLFILLVFSLLPVIVIPSVRIRLYHYSVMHSLM